MVVEYDRQKTRAEFMQTFVRDPAEVFVIQHGDSLPDVTGVNEDSYESLRGFPELAELLASCYYPEAKVGNFDVLRRNPAQ